MASSQSNQSDRESTLHFLRNPLKLLKQKGSIVPAQGHVFNTALACTHCGRMWYEQRAEPTSCAASQKLASPDEPVAQTPDEPVARIPGDATPGSRD